MKPSRRRFLRGSVLGLLGAILTFILVKVWPRSSRKRVVRKKVRPAAPAKNAEMATLARVVDLLVPRDETPGALDLGVHLEVREGLVKQNHWKSVRRGLRWLEREARKQGAGAFVGLSLVDQIRLLERAEKAPMESVQRDFFRKTRYYTFFYYYAHPQAWEKLSYGGPPQPNGYMSYRSRPRGG